MEWPKELKRTKQRALVLEVLDAAEHPLTAMDISAQLEQRGDRVWLSTVYRVLEAFTQAGVAVKTDLWEGMALYELHSRQHRHYAVCVGCKRVIPMQGCPLEQVPAHLLEENFQVVGHRLQLYGYCGDCAHPPHGSPHTAKPRGRE